MEVSLQQQTTACLALTLRILMIMTGSHLNYNNLLDLPGPDTLDKRSSLMSVMSSGSGRVSGRMISAGVL